MEKAAEYSEIQAYLSSIPAASLSWADGFYALRTTMAVIRKLVETMSRDSSSPLRAAEEGVMAKEMRRVQQERGMHVVGAGHSGRVNVKISAVLDPSDQTKVSRLVGAFSLPQFRPSNRFVSNGHAVANVVRRCCSAYLLSKFGREKSLMEVGPDERHWLLSSSDDLWESAKAGRYQGSRPVLGPRDSVRASWRSLAKVIAANKSGDWKQGQVERAQLLLDEVTKVFPRERVQRMKGNFEYVVSMDANYDIAFSDMPDAMYSVGARGWLGYMSRAKGVTRFGGPDEGSLDLMGSSFRVNRRADKIRFSQWGSSGFGYEHKFSEYVKYEEHNGYVWHAHGYHYVYNKLPETNSEILFYSVVRVPTVVGLQEPRFVENVNAGMLKISSVWSVGDECSGVPTSFERVEFVVDKINFEKVLEKRRALDFRGCLSTTLTLVRSTNVRFWLSGVPVSAENKTASKLSEAVAIAVEVLAAEGRLNTGMTFDKAMGQFKVEVQKDSFFFRMLEDLFSMRVVFGKVVKPITNLWHCLRGVLADAALRPMSELRVSISEVPYHDKLPGQGYEVGSDEQKVDSFDSMCVCSRLADARAVRHYAVGEMRAKVDKLISSIESYLPCNFCTQKRQQWTESWAAVPEEVEGDDDAESVVTTTVDSATVVSEGDGEVYDNSSVCTSVDVEVLTDCGNGDTGYGKSWHDNGNEGSVEFMAMQECIDLESHLIDCALSEARADATRIVAGGEPSERLVKELSSARVKHAALKFEGQRIVKTVAADSGDFGAVYDMEKDAIVPIKRKGSSRTATVKAGWHYTSSKLRVWNGPDVIASLSYAMDYGRVRSMRGFYKVTLGVPGAGKTRGMIKKLADEWCDESILDMVLCVTNAAVDEAREYAALFGIPDSFITRRMMTLDRYLLWDKSAARVLCVDEFPMVHIARVDAAVVLSRCAEVRITGDAKQIMYDPFCATFRVEYSRLGDTVPEEFITFLPETHRCAEDVCAAYVDQYPSFYPCKCCRAGEKERPTLSWEKVVSLGGLLAKDDTRYHVYKQDEKEDLRMALNFRDSMEKLRARPRGGLASVGEDQGSTHKHVETYRLTTTYDKAAVVRKQSLFNRVEFVLTDMTRHTGTYKYVTMCDEVDEVILRIAKSKDPARLAAVRERRGFENVSLTSLLN